MIKVTIMLMVKITIMVTLTITITITITIMIIITITIMIMILVMIMIIVLSLLKTEILFPEAHFCVDEDDKRFEPMCSHPLNGPGVNGLMLGKDECTSPSGVYDLEIPINRTLSCTDTKMRDTNCKDLDVS